MNETPQPPRQDVPNPEINGLSEEEILQAAANLIRTAPRAFGEKRDLSQISLEMSHTVCSHCGSQWDNTKTNCKNCAGNTPTTKPRDMRTDPLAQKMLSLYQGAHILNIRSVGLFVIPPGIYERIIVNTEGAIVKSGGDVIVLDDVTIASDSAGIIFKPELQFAPGAAMQDFGEGTINKAASTTTTWSKIIASRLG